MTHREPSVEEKNVCGRIAAMVVRWGLAVPAILMLEMHKPLSWVGSQAMHALGPIVSICVRLPDWPVLAKMLERRDGLECLIVAIEHAEAMRGEKA